MIEDSEDSLEKWFLEDGAICQDPVLKMAFEEIRLLEQARVICVYCGGDKKGIYDNILLKIIKDNHRITQLVLNKLLSISEEIQIHD